MSFLLGYYRSRDDSEAAVALGATPQDGWRLQKAAAGELSAGLAGSRTWTMWVRAFPLCLAASIAVSLGGGTLARLVQFQSSQTWDFFFFISWVLRASFLLPGEGKLLCNKRIISTLSGHGTSMFTHEDPHVLCCCLVFNLYAMCIVLSACVFVYHVHTWSTLRPEGTGVTGTGCTNVSCSVVARKQIWVLWKRSQYSQ